MTSAELRAWLDRMRMPQNELAMRIGRNERQIHRWLTGAIAVPAWLELALPGLEAELEAIDRAEAERRRAG